MIVAKINLLVVLSVGMVFLCLGGRPIFAQESSSRLYLQAGDRVQVLRESNGEDVLLTKDYLSSTRVLTEADETRQPSYFPYGERADVSYSEGPSLPDRQFTGHRKLDGLSVYHAGARFYSPRFGQFIQADPVEGPQRYAYASNNPVLLSDRTGYNGECQQTCPSTQGIDYIDLSDSYGPMLEPSFRGTEIYQMPPDGGIPDSVFYPVMGGAAAGLAGAGIGFAAPAVAASSAYSAASGVAGTVVGSTTGKAILGSMAIEAGAQASHGEFHPGGFAEAATLGAATAPWLGASRFASGAIRSGLGRGFGGAISRVASHAPAQLQRFGRGLGHFGHEIVEETIIASPLIGLGVYEDVHSGESQLLGALGSNYIEAKAAIKLMLLARVTGGAAAGRIAGIPFFGGASQSVGQFTRTSYLETIDSISESHTLTAPIHAAEHAVRDFFQGDAVHAATSYERSATYIPY